MKKIIALILALCMLMSFAACTNKDEQPAEPAEPAEPGVILPEVVDPGNEPAAPGEGPEGDNMPSVDPSATDTDIPVELPSTDTDMPTEPLPSTDTDLPAAGDNLPLDILTAVWATYAEDEMFAAAGGDYENMVMDGPGACGLADASALDALFGLPATEAPNVTAAASLMHMMNANTFTSACYELADGANVNAFAESVKANILARQWMCGFPETLVIINVDGCVVTAFGNDDIIQLFKEKLAGCYSTTVLVEEPIV